MHTQVLTGGGSSDKIHIGLDRAVIFETDATVTLWLNRQDGDGTVPNGNLILTGVETAYVERVAGGNYTYMTSTIED